MLHLDIKKLGRIKGVGHRITGNRAGQSRNRGIGWDFVHVCIDDHSRVAYVEVLPDETGATTAAFLDRAVRWFRDQGIRVRRVLTDNGSGYLSKLFAHTCVRLRVKHRRTRPYTPRTNGRRSASSRRCSASASMPGHSPARGGVESHSRAGSGTTTRNANTEH